MNSIECAHVDYFEAHFEDYLTLPKTKLDTSLFLCAYDEYILHLYLKHCIQHTFGILKNTVKCIGELKIETTTHTMVFELKRIGAVFSEFIQYLKEHSSKKALFGNHTVYILKNVHELSGPQQTILQKFVEKNRDHVYILTTYKLNCVCNSLVNTIVPIRIPSFDVENTLRTICKDSGVEYTKKNLKTMIEHCRSRMYPLLLALDNPKYLNVIHAEYMSLFSLIKKVKLMDTFLSRVRITMYKFIVFNIPRNQLCTQLLKSVMIKYKKNTDILVPMCTTIAKLEHDLIFSSKPILHYEYCFLILFELVQG